MSPARHRGVPWRALAAALTVWALGACGSSPAPAGETTTPQRAPTARTSADTPTQAGSSLRALGVDATFGELVVAVRRLEAEGASESAAGCLLRGGRLAPFTLEADLASAVNPLPDAPRELASRLDDPRAGASVLTRWAQHGSASALTLVALTSTPPPGPGPMAVVLLTREGAFLRRSEGGVPAGHAGPVPLPRLGEHLAIIAEGSAGIVFSAEAGVPLDSLRSALAAVPRGAPPVLLAVALDPEVRLPAPPAADPSAHGLCVDGVLPAARAAHRPGTLATDVVRARVDDMAEGAIRCFEFARGDAARGGRMRVLTRIGREGRVTEACATRDELGDPTLRACVLGVVRGLVFPALSDGDYVDVALPLRLLPDTSERQAPLCDP